MMSNSPRMPPCCPKCYHDYEQELAKLKDAEKSAFEVQSNLPQRLRNAKTQSGESESETEAKMPYQSQLDRQTLTIGRETIISFDIRRFNSSQISPPTTSIDQVVDMSRERIGNGNDRRQPRNYRRQEWIPRGSTPSIPPPPLDTTNININTPFASNSLLDANHHHPPNNRSHNVSKSHFIPSTRGRGSGVVNHQHQQNMNIVNANNSNKRKGESLLPHLVKKAQDRIVERIGRILHRFVSDSYILWRAVWKGRWIRITVLRLLHQGYVLVVIKPFLLDARIRNLFLHVASIVIDASCFCKKKIKVVVCSDMAVKGHANVENDGIIVDGSERKLADIGRLEWLEWGGISRCRYIQVGRYIETGRIGRVGVLIIREGRVQ
ncbi:hypothetical protein Tco_1317024 [Tanacetum coccineum]